MAEATITIPEELKAKMENLARERGISFESFLEESLQKSLTNREQDPFFADTAVFSGEVPSDTALNPDKYLYD